MTCGGEDGKEGIEAEKGLAGAGVVAVVAIEAEVAGVGEVLDFEEEGAAPAAPKSFLKTSLSRSCRDAATA